tara:strand:- start:350 stop:922 length:573 start_codon:yes stop_codon:yes gene_type:complete
MVTINWVNNKNIDNKLSILEFINKDSYNIRELFFELISDIGNYNLLNKPLYDHLKYKNIQSMWVMSLINQKSHYKSEYLDDIIKIIAFKKYVEKENPDEVFLENSNQKTFETLKKYCDLKNIKLHEIDTVKKNKFKIHELLPNFIQAILWISKIFIEHSWLKKRKNKTHDSEIFICSYFSHLNGDELKKV